MVLDMTAPSHQANIPDQCDQTCLLKANKIFQKSPNIVTYYAPHTQGIFFKGKFWLIFIDLAK
jgi:hypothetical protein